MGGTELNKKFKISISGIVQGVGFRPFIYNLAQRHNLKGYVFNNSQGVEIHLQCHEESLQNFIHDINSKNPPRSKIKKINTAQYFSPGAYTDFSIRFSKKKDSISAEISPDLDICPDCLQELFDKTNRRYLYPFINCTNCGPRFTITKNIPYDRQYTTMHDFKMCESCRQEYENPANRRFHAQPNGCYACGPKIELLNNKHEKLFIGGNSNEVKKICEFIATQLKSGRIVAIKGIGGFHFACDALNETAVKNLRARKYREDKPFALMFPEMASIRRYCEVSIHEEKLLTDYQHPIVLLKNKIKVANSVAPGNNYLGCMLPYTPIHHLLMYFFPNPLVMTSGNVSDEPVKYLNDDALNHLSNIADFFLLNDRDIHIRCDDSVVRSYNKQSYFIRRSRGYTPMDLNINYSFSRNILACGGQQKNVFAFSKQDKIFLSHHIGDLKNYSVLKSFEKGIEHFKNIFEISPEIIAIDKHPDYLSHIFGKEYATQHELPTIEIQHHHAHAAACMAEHELNEKVIALVLDGTGYGDNGNIWGGECLVCDYNQAERIAHFREVKMPGGEFAIKNIAAMGLAYLFEIFGDEIDQLSLPFLKKIKERGIIIEMLQKNLNSPITTSCGRLFDGIAAICGFRDFVNYEGQAAVEFEQAIANRTKAYYNFSITNNNIIDWEPAIREIILDVNNKVSHSIISEKFHRGLVKIFLQLLIKIRQNYNINKIVLSGGVFMNLFLLKNLEFQLINHNFGVYTHKKVPANDGGIALGQLFIADHKFNQNS